MTSRKVSMESPKENKVPPQDQECKGPSQDHRPRTEDNVTLRQQVLWYQNILLLKKSER